ncbi:MAG: flavodoxin domain-containing protein [Candidatus Thorarchaeota archaeon]|nr:flavodoxin domain-containing protein [Candidatus Thorarchaeota archaeon]
MKVLIVFESTTGRTKAMAEAICKGVQEAGGECEMIRAREFTTVDRVCAFALGTSTRMKRPLPKTRQILAELEPLNGLPVTAFGSYGWSGEAPEIVATKLRELGGKFVGERPLRVKEHPRENDIESCIKLGEELASQCK